MKGGALWLAYTNEFSRNQLLNAYIDAVVGVEPLVRLANAEVAFLAGVFVGVAEVVGAHVLDLGLKVYANRELAGAAFTAARDLCSAHQCLRRTVPEVIADLDRTAAWEAIRNFPNTITAEQIAFWLGRVIRAIVSAKDEGLKLTLEIVVKEVIWVTELLGAIDFALNSGESLANAIQNNAQELVQRMAQENVQISETKAARWMRAFAENPESQRCLAEFRTSASKLRDAIQRLMPGIFVG